MSASTGTGLRTRLTVSGMTCGNCVHHVQDALAEIPGVSASVDLDAALATVTHPATVPVRALLDAVEEAGYDAVPHDGMSGTPDLAVPSAPSVGGSAGRGR